MIAPILRVTPLACQWLPKHLIRGACIRCDTGVRASGVRVRRGNLCDSLLALFGAVALKQGDIVRSGDVPAPRYPGWLPLSASRSIQNRH